MTKYIRYHADEWTGLYEDGKLVSYGDAYRQDEYLASKLGVEERYESDDWLIDNQTPVKTIQEVEERRSAREARESVASALREQAQLLLRQAEELEQGNE